MAIITDETLIDSGGGYYEHKGGSVATTGATLIVSYVKGDTDKLTINALTTKKSKTERSFVTEMASDGKVSVWEPYIDANTPAGETFSIPVTYDTSDQRLFWKIVLSGGSTGQAWISSHLDSRN